MRTTRWFQGALAVLVLGGIVVAATVHAKAEAPAKAVQAADQEVRCPVTGDVVTDPSTALKSVYKGRTYYFCCPACKPKFDADPEKYVGKPAPEKPMHLSGHGDEHHGH